MSPSLKSLSISISLSLMALQASAFPIFPDHGGRQHFQLNDTLPPPPGFEPNPNNDGNNGGQSNQSRPIKLSDVQSVINALKSGHTVSVESNLGQCLPHGKSPASQVQDGRIISSYTVGNDGIFRFSGTRLYAPKDESGAPMEILYQYQADPSQTQNTIRYFSQSFNLPSFKEGGERVSYDCQIGQGVNFYQTN